MVGQALTADQMKVLPEDDAYKGEIDVKYKEHVEKLSEEFRKILRRYDVPHVIQAKLGVLGWNNAMDFGDRYSDIKEVIDVEEGAPKWLGFLTWDDEAKLKAAVHCGQAWRECSSLTKMVYNVDTPEKTTRGGTGMEDQKWGALVSAEKRKTLKKYWVDEETEEFPEPKDQPSDALIKETWKMFDKDTCPQLEWKELTLMIPDTNDDEHPEWDTINGRREKTGKNLARVPQTIAKLKEKVKLHNRVLRMVTKAFRSNPQFDMQSKDWKAWEDFWFGDYIAGRKDEPPVWVLRNLHEKVWRQVRLDMETKKITMSKAVADLTSNMMFFQAHFTEKLTQATRKGEGTKGTGKSKRGAGSNPWQQGQAQVQKHSFGRFKRKWSEKERRTPYNAPSKNYEKGKGKGKWKGKGKGKGKDKKGKGKGKKGKGDRKGKSDALPDHWVTRTNDGKMFCMNFLRRRTCTDPTQCGKLHSCCVWDENRQAACMGNHLPENCPNKPSWATE